MLKHICKLHQWCKTHFTKQHRLSATRSNMVQEPQTYILEKKTLQVDSIELGSTKGGY